MDERQPRAELDPRHLEALRERIAESPFHGWAGMELVRVGGGEAELAMKLEDHHFNPQRIVHGGIIAAMADTAIGLALRSILAPGSTHRTAQLGVHFLAKGEGTRLVGRGRASTWAPGWATGRPRSWTGISSSWPGPRPPSSSSRLPAPSEASGRGKIHFRPFPPDPSVPITRAEAV
jgi:uncharacterized protein (TIGR00369 family)